MGTYTCHDCGRRAAEDPAVRPPCELRDPEARPEPTGYEWSPLFGTTPTRRYPLLPCPAGIPLCDRAAFLAGRNERRGELRAERRKTMFSRDRHES